MVKPAWGMKRVCQSCGARFYDLQREPIVCPKCSAVYDPDSASRTRRGRSAAAEKVVALKPAETTEAAEVELEDVDVDLDVSDEDLVLEEESEEDEEDLIEDASELGEDDEDMAEVIENVDDEDER